MYIEYLEILLLSKDLLLLENKGFNLYRYYKHYHYYTLQVHENILDPKLKYSWSEVQRGAEEK